MKIAIDRIDPDPNQPRRHFGGLEEPAESIKANGLIEPITARPAPGPAAMFTSNTPEWYTPPEIIEAVRDLFGGTIDLDPCSNSHDAPNVPATEHYTREDDGLSRAWHGRVYMNPPYVRYVIDKWIEKVREEYESGRVAEAAVLVAARTDTQWYRILSPTYPRCEIEGRLRFTPGPKVEHAGGGKKAGKAGFPSVVFYLGQNMSRFVEVFSDLGVIVAPWPLPAATRVEVP